MVSGKGTPKSAARTLGSWFALTPDERLFVAGIVAVLLIGIVARYAYLASEKPETFQPQGVERIDQGGR